MPQENKNKNGDKKLEKSCTTALSVFYI